MNAPGHFVAALNGFYCTTLLATIFYSPHFLNGILDIPASGHENDSERKKSSAHTPKGVKLPNDAVPA
jgi:hypothetical protein